MKTAFLVAAAFAVGLTVGAILFPGALPSISPSGPAARERDESRPSRPEPSADESAPQDREATREAKSAAGHAEGNRDSAPVRVGFSSSRSRYLSAVRAEYERRGAGEFPEDVRGAMLDEAVENLNRQVTWSAGWLATWEERRRRLGVLANPLDLLIQARGQIRVGAYAALDRYQARHLLDRPLELGERSGTAAYVRGGVIPYGRVLVIDRIELIGRLGYEVRSAPDNQVSRVEPGSLTVKVDNRAAIRLNGNLEISGSIVGPMKVGHLTSSIMEVDLSRGAVEARAVGRIMNRAEAEAIRAETPRFAPAGSDGYLKTGRVLLQVLADHGGGNDRKVRMDGSTYRIDGVRASDLWDDTLDIDELDDSLAYYEGTGLVPPGKVFRITRIDYRARLSKKKLNSSDFKLVVAGKTVVDVKAKQDTAPTGSWYGPVDIRPGNESGVEIICSCYGMGEAVIWGSVEDGE